MTNTRITDLLSSLDAECHEDFFVHDSKAVTINNISKEKLDIMIKESFGFLYSNLT